uniref:polysaccharide biosynthesis protein n=1 Tax=Eubacterium cellulosolvens TaxID=29322 RepID=UPI00048A102A|nr:polysaccharide biosynthesis protein [[Eubacterium] cellulosolvens]
MKKYYSRILLILYDVLIFAFIQWFLNVFYKGTVRLSFAGLMQQSVLMLSCIAYSRWAGQLHRQIWRYGGIQCYTRLILMDALGFGIYCSLEKILPVEHIRFDSMLAAYGLFSLATLSMRMVYRYAYKCGNQDNFLGKLLRTLLRIFAFGRVLTEAEADQGKIKIAIIGAGSVGLSLAEDLLNNPRAQYVPRCFVDIDKDKIGRDVRGIPILSESEATFDKLREHQIQEVVFAVPKMARARKLELYEYYRKSGFGIKNYDFPAMEIPGRKRQMREFSVEDLLFRKELHVIDPGTCRYYRDKVILITGGGGSIGSELCRQLAKMHPKRLIIADIYENCAYDVQQGLSFAYKGKLDIRVEIVSVTNKEGLSRVFEEYHPDITIHAAAHKHVPLMEKNALEAVTNNVFGTLNVMQLCEEYGCGRFMLVSTDKAVNPTNVMGATKRVCEMIMQAYSTVGKVRCSATRFGNVLGSAGSVIPLFKRQIEAGGPITVTDRRIIRYFMTIPEASQLVLESGAMAESGELFVLDMGKAVKIWQLAETMIRISGVNGIDIVETGLRPGEKLYEELLVKKDELDRTENDMIFVERELPLSMEELEEKLAILSAACATGSDAEVKRALQRVVPTYRTPDEVNRAVAPDETENRLQKEEIQEVGTASKASRISAGAIG